MTPADLLAIEARWPRHTPAKDAAIRARGISPVRFYQLLPRAAESLEGVVADPVTARRVRKVAASRARRREQRTLA